MKKIIFLLLLLLFNNSYSQTYSEAMAQCQAFTDHQNSTTPWVHTTATISYSCADYPYPNICSSNYNGSPQMQAAMSCAEMQVNCSSVDGDYDPISGLCTESKDCFDSYNDLDSIASGIQCTCSGALPMVLNDGSMSCDGVTNKCDIGQQKITDSVNNETLTYCRDVEICDPLTDENSCGLPKESACITTDLNSPCLDPDTLVDNTVPDLCGVGYYFSSTDRKCYPILDRKTIIDNETGETKQQTTVNNGGDVNNNSSNNSTTFNTTTDSETGEEKTPESEAFNAPESGTGFDVAAAEADVLTAKSSLTTQFNTMKSEAENLMSVNTGAGTLPCYEFELPFGGGYKNVCLDEYSSFFDIMIPAIQLLAYFLAIMIIMRN